MTNLKVKNQNYMNKMSLNKTTQTLSLLLIFFPNNNS